MKLPRRWIIRAIVAVIAVCGAALLYWQMTLAGQSVVLHHHNYYVSVMRTDAELQRGLSGTDSLPADHAMLFIFPDNYVPKMWMKDMKYPIDMVWLNDDGVVIHMEKSVQPASYPKTYQSNTPAHYVIELPSGTIIRTGIVIGDPAGLPSGI
jgi:uncharacterized membrane protein (UPF0127 family)